MSSLSISSTAKTKPTSAYYQILAEKFKLFEGVFGASDEVLGTIESGVDFEKRIAEIYQNCRTQDQIKSSFDQLQLDLGAQINNFHVAHPPTASGKLRSGSA